MRRFFAALAIVLAAASGARAQTPAPQVWLPPAELTQKPAKPVQAFGADNPSCRQWTDGCVTCSKQADDLPACSTAGESCIPNEPTCSKFQAGDSGGIW